MRYRVEWNALPSARNGAGQHLVRDEQTGRVVKGFPDVPDCMAWTQYAAEAEAYRLELEHQRLAHILEREQLINATRARLMGFAALVDVMRVPS